MSILPKNIIESTTGNPKRLVFYSAIKSGKTSALAMLPDTLILDFEDGSDYVSALKMKVIGILTPKEEDEITKATRIEENKFYLQEIVAALKEEGKPYRRIAVDTTTGLEDMLMPVSAALYRATPMGSKWGLDKDGKPLAGANVLTLPNGAGELYHRSAFEKIIQMLEEVCDELILSGHLKEKITDVSGKEVTSKDIDLRGKLKNIACAKADAVAYLYRKGNQVLLNFNTSEEVTCGARPEHLKNKEIVLTEMIDDKLVAYWDKVYIN